jgi:hypothetical protein
MAKFTKAKSEQAFVKLGLYGATGSGKTFTSMLIAEGLSKREGKRFCMIDTERGSDFYALGIKERTIHPEAFDFDRIVTRSIFEAIEAIESIDTNIYAALLIDSITHLWEAVKAAYNGKMLPNGAIPIQAWSTIKKPYKRLMSLFLDGKWHGIICGREGIVMEEDDDGETKVVGHKMKSEGETPYEPHILGRMIPERDKKGGYIIKVFFEKDRSGILNGKEYLWPNYDLIAPIIGYLSGENQGTVGTLEDAAEKDAAAQERQAEKETQERQAIYEQIRTAILTASTVEQLSAAWSLTKGKKTKLGDELFGNLTTAKDTRKNELMGVA